MVCLLFLLPPLTPLLGMLLPSSCCSVEVLKGAIHRAVRVPPDKQVLLASGGETLDSSKRVCHYSASTDTSPIFLFSKMAIEGAAPPTPTVDCGGEDDLKVSVVGVAVVVVVSVVVTYIYAVFPGV